jgi:hypothetical protein
MPAVLTEERFSSRAGKLRHPRFVGLRRDKRPREVVLERRAA